MDELLYGNMSLWGVAGAGAALAALPRMVARLRLSRAKHPSLAGHSRMAKRMARLVPAVHYDEQRFFAADDAPEEVIAQRRAGLDRLAAEYDARFPQSAQMAAAIADSLPDARFTGTYRVPFQFSQYLRTRLRVAPVMTASSGFEMQDADGNTFIDLTGSYGVNVFGIDFYKAAIAEGARRADALGPVLGAYHPALAWNVRRLREISGLDAVSFHMSGTEAVMQAVRLARYHTGRSHIVRFCGAYHGWWDDVQPGVGNPMPPRETYTLRDMDPRSLGILRSRKDIACVLVNPLQALHPNANPPGDSALLGGRACGRYDRAAYADWLAQLRLVCSERGIALIFDEVFLGFRLAQGGAQEYFGVRADMVTYGKTLGGGLPVGVVCGRADLMKRFRDDAPADVCLARGTFNAHPYVMTAMQVFLERLGEPAIAATYVDADARWNARCEAFNAAMRAADLPIAAWNLQSVWAVAIDVPSRYNWMLQFYLRAEGLALSWVGTGRLIFPLNFDDDSFAETIRRFVRAGHRMQVDGWWWHAAEASTRGIGRTVMKELLVRRVFFMCGAARQAACSCCSPWCGSYSSPCSRRIGARQ